MEESHWSGSTDASSQSSAQEGRNPFVEQKTNHDRSYDRVLDLCVKAGSPLTPQRSVQSSVVRLCWMKRLTACFSPWLKW